MFKKIKDFLFTASKQTTEKDEEPVYSATPTPPKAPTPLWLVLTNTLLPTLCAVAYVVVGLVSHIWHPTWILWITIPIYYVLCDAYKKSKAPAGAATNGTYYTPNTANAQTSSAYAQEQGKSGKTATVILGVLIGVLLTAVIGSFSLAAVYSFNNDSVITTED